MASHPLIILRGNSGCGKTSTARLLQCRLGYGTMLVSQDVVRREILCVKDSESNPAIQLIYDLCMYGNKVGYTVILEGILSNKKYGTMLHRLLNDFQGEKLIYFLTYRLRKRCAATLPSQMPMNLVNWKCASGGKTKMFWVCQASSELARSWLRQKLLI